MRSRAVPAERLLERSYLEGTLDDLLPRPRGRRDSRVDRGEVRLVALDLTQAALVDVCARKVADTVAVIQPEIRDFPSSATVVVVAAQIETLFRVRTALDQAGHRFFAGHFVLPEARAYGKRAEERAEDQRRR